MVPVVTVPIYLLISFQSLKAKSREVKGGQGRSSDGGEFFFPRLEYLST